MLGGENMINTLKIGATVKIVSLLVLMGIVLSFMFTLTTPHLVSTLGLNGYAAKKIIDIISAATSIWAIIGLVAAVIGGGGIGVGILATAKWLANKYGKAYARMW
jgi:circularin A/uberolysin family circular bacteriocin